MLRRNHWTTPSCLFADDDDDDNPEIEADEAAGEVRSRPTVHTPGPWFDRILGAY